MISERKGTLPVAIKGVVARRGHDPVIPPHVAEVHVQRVSLTARFEAFPLLMFCLTLFSFVQRVSLPVMAKSYQQRPDLGPAVSVWVQRPANPHVSLGDTWLLLRVSHFHHEAVVGLSLSCPAHHGGGDVKTFPLAGVPIDQPGVQQSAGGEFRVGCCGFDNFININSVMEAVIVAQSVLHLFSENLKLRRGDQLLGGNRS